MQPSTPDTCAIAQVAKERRTAHHEADVVIVGAGILGCAAAVALSNQGRSVILLERSLQEPDRIVGELLQPGGIAVLEKLGLRDCLEGIDAIPVHGYALLYGEETAQIPYPCRVAHGKTRERSQGRSFHHGRFVAKLRRAAMACPNVSVIESTATELVRSGYTGQVLGVESKTAGLHDYYFGDLTIVADGYASKFRKDVINRAPVVKSKFWALELIDADLPFPNHAQAVLVESSTTLFYQIGTHETRVLIDIPNDLPSASVQNGGVKGHLRNVVLPAIPANLRPSFEAALDHDRLRSMPNSWLPSTANKTPGLVMVGDAMNMRHPLTGGGMTVALSDALMLSELLDPSKVPRLDDTKLVLKQLLQFHWKRKHLTGVINVVAQALYILFSGDESQLKVLKLGAFRYLQIKGSASEETAGLLGGIVQRPLILVYHFYKVAFLAIWLHITSASIAGLPLRLLGSFGILWKACVVIFPFLFFELQT